MQIAVTGGNGRLGRAVAAAALAEGHEVVALDRATDTPTGGGRPAGPPPVPVHPLDVADFDALAGRLQGCDALVHLAAMPSPFHHPAHVVHANNVVGNYNALTAAADAGIRRIVSASSVNAIGGFYSRRARYDYLPLDEEHPTYAEDPYSLSKWLGEQQADAVARLHEDVTIASLRFHWITPERPSWSGEDDERLTHHARHLWGWVDRDAAVRACLLGLMADFAGHEVFYVVAPTTATTLKSSELYERFHADVPLRRELDGSAGFYDCAKAARLLGWVHDA